MTKKYSELNKINLREASSKIVGSQIKINSRQNQSIWVIFETDDENLDSIDSKMVDIPQDNDKDKDKNKKPDDDVSGGDGQNIIVKNQVKVDDETIKKEFFESFFEMNDDFIYIEPKLIPIIPGDDPAIINKVSEFSEDNF